MTHRSALQAVACILAIAMAAMVPLDGASAQVKPKAKKEAPLPIQLQAEAPLVSRFDSPRVDPATASTTSTAMTVEIVHSPAAHSSSVVPSPVRPVVTAASALPVSA